MVRERAIAAAGPDQMLVEVAHRVLEPGVSTRLTLRRIAPASGAADHFVGGECGQLVGGQPEFGEHLVGVLTELGSRAP